MSPSSLNASIIINSSCSASLSCLAQIFRQSCIIYCLYSVQLSICAGRMWTRAQLRSSTADRCVGASFKFFDQFAEQRADRFRFDVVFAEQTHDAPLARGGVKLFQERA